MSERLLLDIHVWIWMALGTLEYKAVPKIRLTDAAEQNNLYISAITLFEVANLVHRNRVMLSLPLSAWFELTLTQPGVKTLPVTPEIAVASTTLPPAFHRDPNDRLIASTAIAHDMVLCTHDHQLLRFGEQGAYKFLEI